MNIFQAAILGIVEGITEYLPISSTFHLIWTATILGLKQTEFQKAFEVIIQTGAILAVIVLFFKTVISDFKLIKNLLLSFVPTAIVGLMLYKTIKGSFFESFTAQIIIFLAIGVFFILFEKWNRHKSSKRTLVQITPVEAILVGLAQATSIFPGVSRAGAVIVALLFLKIDRREAAKYSFLLAVPTLISASVLDLIKSKDALLASANNIPILIVGFIFSFISAIIVVKWFIGFLQKNGLTVFGWYRIAVGLILFILFTQYF